MAARLYVGNLPYDADERSIRGFFGDVDGHKVTQVKIVTDRETGRPRGFAFVELSHSSEAKAAISEFNGRALGGRSVVVSEAREPEHGSGGFAGNGGGGRGSGRDRGGKIGGGNDGYGS